MEFKERISCLRKDKGYSQEDLAEKLGISRQAVAKWEAGLSYPDVDNLITLSNLFHISIDQLLKPDEECSKTSFRDDTDSNNPITMDMIEFLCKAKQKTYAGNTGATASSRPSSHDLGYQEGDYTYIDTYLGGEKFSGEEAIWWQGTPIWSMNYCGRVIGEGFSGDFLKEALLLVPMDQPYRGPKVYRNGDYSYHSITDGSVEWFQGYEEIFLLDMKVYECYFHGGSVKQ